MNLNQVTVPVLDIERATRFYQILGLILIVKSPHYARFECPVGEATFSVHLAEKLPRGKGINVYFETDNLNGIVKELIAQGIEFEHLPTDQKWLWREARLKDPDGNQLVLYTAGENRKNPPWKIT